MVCAVNKRRNWVIMGGCIAVALLGRLSDWAFMPILPSLCALVLVYSFRSALIGLIGGAFVGALLVAPSVLVAPVYLLSDLLLPALQSRWNICVLMFTLIMGGFVGILDFGGGMSTLVHALTRHAKPGSKRLEWITFGLGFGCFFDGLANSMLVGSTMRPVYNQRRTDRNRLAYIGDSTSSPVACVAFLSTWIAYQLSMIQEGLASAQVDANPYLVFLSAIPGNYYCWFTLILVAVVIHRNWNPAATSPPASVEVRHTAPNSSHPAKLYSIWAPLLFLMGGLPLGLWWSGRRALQGQTDVRWIDTFAAADTALILVLIGLGASLVAALVYPRNAPNTVEEGFIRGMERLVSPALILISAWALSASLKQLDAGEWIGSALAGTVPNALLPALVFVVGGAISFLTGTSWGTMGILVPLVIPLGVTAGGDPGQLGGLGVSVLAAAFSGAVFGDHCSPISDTTIVSSMSAGVTPFEHVRTQLPYAFTAASIAVFPGFLLAGLTGSFWPGLLVGVMALVVFWYGLGLRNGSRVP